MESKLNQEQEKRRRQCPYFRLTGGWCLAPAHYYLEDGEEKRLRTSRCVNVKQCDFRDPKGEE